MRKKRGLVGFYKKEERKISCVRKREELVKSEKIKERKEKERRERKEKKKKKKEKRKEKRIRRTRIRHFFYICKFRNFFSFK